MTQRNKQSITIESNRLIIEKKKLCHSSVIKNLFLFERSIKLKQDTMAILIKTLHIMTLCNVAFIKVFYFNDINKVIFS